MKTVEILIYGYSDLLEPENEAVKERAFDYMKEHWSLHDIEFQEPCDSLKAVKELIEDAPAEIEDNRLRTWIMNNAYVWKTNAQYSKINGKLSKNYYDQTKYHKGKNRVSRITMVDKPCPLTGVCYDDAYLSVLTDFVKNPDGDKWTILSALDSKHEEIIDGIYEWTSSDEYLLDMIEANDYEFTEDGKPYF